MVSGKVAPSEKALLVSLVIAPLLKISGAVAVAPLLFLILIVPDALLMPATAVPTLKLFVNELPELMVGVNCATGASPEHRNVYLTLVRPGTGVVASGVKVNNRLLIPATVGVHAKVIVCGVPGTIVIGKVGL